MTLGDRALALCLALGRSLASRPALAFLGFASLYTATYDSDMGSPDEHQRYGLALATARRGLSALKGSGLTSKYPPLQSLFSAPLMKLGLLLDGGVDGRWTHHLGLAISLMACAALVPLFYWSARTLEIPARRAALATALFGITNPLWPYSKRFFSEPLTAMLALGAFAGGLAYVRRGRGWALGLGLLCLAVLPLNNTVVPLGVGLALGLLFLLERRRKAILALAGTTLVSAGLVAASYLLRFGSLLKTGYQNERFNFHILEGLHGLLFGWGRSVFVYAPLVILSFLGLRALWRRSRSTALAMLAAFSSVILLVASWWCWWGGICWGPRLVLPVLPIASIGAAAFLAEPRRWKVPLAVAVGLAGLYVQFIGFSFRHDFDIYFWMNGSYSDERRAWFDWDRSSVRRMPRHFREHPWDLSSAFLALEQEGPSVIELAGAPARRVRITQRGDALVYNWSIADIWAVVREGGVTRRVPAKELGARLVTFNGRDGSPALDGDPRTRWATGSKRLDGMWVTLELDRLREDLVRLELEHMPSEHDFPNGLTARVQAEGEAWTEVPARAATPRLRWNPLILVFALGGALLVLGALRRGRGAIDLSHEGANPGQTNEVVARAEELRLRPTDRAVDPFL